MRWGLVVLMVGHGLIHLMGVAEGFGWADLEQVEQPVSAAEGVAWLLASGLVLAAAGLLALRARPWWIVTAVAAVVSQGVILTAWDDTRAGTAANVLMLVAPGYRYLSPGPVRYPLPDRLATHLG